MSSKRVSTVSPAATKTIRKAHRLTAKKTRKSLPTAWTLHCHTCSELYGVTYQFAVRNGEMRMLYYTPSNRDAHGNVMYPKQLHMIGTPGKSSLLREPWTGEAVRDPEGYSKDAVIV